MTTELYADNAITTLAGTGQPWANAPAAGTSEAWQVASTAGRFPAVTSGTNQMRMVVAPVAGDPDPEIVIATNTVDGTHWQVTRGAEGSTVKAHAAGDQIAAVLTAGNLPTGGGGGGPTYTWTATKTAAYTAVTGDAVPCDTTSGAFPVHLPAGVKDNTVRVNCIAGANTLTVDVTGGGTINGAASFVFPQTSTPRGSTDFSCLSAGVWVIV